MILLWNDELWGFFEGQCSECSPPPRAPPTCPGCFHSGTCRCMHWCCPSCCPASTQSSSLSTYFFMRGRTVSTARASSTSASSLTPSYLSSSMCRSKTSLHAMFASALCRRGYRHNSHCLQQKRGVCELAHVPKKF